MAYNFTCDIRTRLPYLPAQSLCYCFVPSTHADVRDPKMHCDDLHSNSRLEEMEINKKMSPVFSGRGHPRPSPFLCVRPYLFRYHLLSAEPAFFRASTVPVCRGETLLGSGSECPFTFEKHLLWAQNAGLRAFSFRNKMLLFSHCVQWEICLVLIFAPPCVCVFFLWPFMTLPLRANLVMTASMQLSSHLLCLEFIELLGSVGG